MQEVPGDSRRQTVFMHVPHQRLKAITRCADELARCVNVRGKPGHEMATLGECDWLCELHRFLYEETYMALPWQDTGNDEHRCMGVIPAPNPELTRLLEATRNRGIGGAPTRATTLPTEPLERKKFPVASGVLDYFPDAIASISHLSYRGNEQHNPGQPLHWARGKSSDEADTMMRHFLQRGTLDTDGVRHSTKMVWRALAILQKEIEAEQEGACQ
jgi:hypothetical protein